MNVIGLDYARSLAAGTTSQLKMVFNASGAIFFLASEQHRDQHSPCICYADDSAGNALAAMVSSGKLEIRFHRDFSDARVRYILSALLTIPELSFLADWSITYQGRALSFKETNH